MMRKPIITVLGHVDHGKCLAKGTQVFLANGELKPIEEIFESTYKNGKKIIHDDGLCIELEKPLWVLGEENNQTKPMIISHVWKLEKKELVRIECENGFSIETTPEHPFPVINENFGVSYVPCKDLQENSYVLVPALTQTSIEGLENIKSRIIDSLAEKNFLVFIERPLARQILQINKHCQKTRHYYDGIRKQRFRIPALVKLCQNMPKTQIYEKIQSVKQSSSKWRAGHTSKRINIPKTAEELEGLFYFAGLFFGDGDNKTGKLCNNDAKLLEFYKQYCEKAFKIACTIGKGHTCSEAFPNGGKTLTVFLQTVFEIPEGKKSGKIIIPKIVQCAPNELIAAFIQGYFDTDGYVDLNNGVEISSNSKKMLSGLAFLLLRFGVRCLVRKNKKAYRLTIKGKNNIKNFASQIGFTLPRKKERLKKYIEISGTSRVLDKTPIHGTQLRELRKRFGIGNKRLQIPYLEKTETYSKVSFHYITQFSNKLAQITARLDSKNQEALKQLENLENLTNSQLGFSKIVKKQFIQNEHGFVYDLTQPKTHNFIANGFLVHNTKLLDSIRGTAVAEKEAGKITQHIGATEVPIEIVKKISGELLEKYGFKLGIPGLLFIDTPGHEAFTNLRKRGGSIADLAVLVIDIMQGIQPQTLESIEILKAFKVPFVVAANKIDLIQGYDSQKGSVTENLKKQQKHALDALDEKIYKLVGELWKQGFSCERFDKIGDFTKQVPIIPVSAKKSEGLPEVLLFLAGLSQKYMEKNLKMEVSGAGKGTVLEVKKEKGLGQTIDVILYDGVIRVGEEIVLASFDGVIKTKIRALLQPKPLDEIRDPKEKFNSVKEVSAAAGTKIVAPGLENALAGSPVLVVKSGKEEEIVKEEVKGIEIESGAVGPIVKADALGSLEAVVKMLDAKAIKPRIASVGEVSRRDILEAKSVSEKDRFKGVVVAFNVKLNESAQKAVKELGVKVFEERVVYKLLEDYYKWVEGEKESEKKSALDEIVWPARIKIMQGCVFRNCNPAIVGVRVLEGKLRAGVGVFKEKGVLGKIKAIQDKGEALKEAKQGQEVAVSIDDANVGRNLFEGDELYTYIPAESFEKARGLLECFTQTEKELLEEIREKQKKLKK